MSANIESINNGENILVGDNIEVVNNVSLVEPEKEVEQEVTAEATEIEAPAEESAEVEEPEEPVATEEAIAQPAEFPSVELPEVTAEVPTYEVEEPTMPEASIDLSGLLPTNDIGSYQSETTFPSLNEAPVYNQFETPSFENSYNSFNAYDNFNSNVVSEPSIPEGCRRALDMIETEVKEIFNENINLKNKNAELENKIAELNVSLDNYRTENASLKTKISENENKMDLSRQRVLDFFGMNTIAPNAGNVQYTANDNNYNDYNNNGGMGMAA